MSYTIGYAKALKLIRSINAERIIIISAKSTLIPVKDIGNACVKGVVEANSISDIDEPGVYFGCIEDAGALYEHLYENAGWFVLVLWVYNDLSKAELVEQGKLYDIYAKTFNNKFITVLAESQ